MVSPAFTHTQKNALKYRTLWVLSQIIQGKTQTETNPPKSQNYEKKSKIVKNDISISIILFFFLNL